MDTRGNLSDSEIEKIANEIRERITGGKSLTLEEYIGLAKKKKGDEIGLFYLWLLNNRPGLQTYFCEEILEVLLKKKGRHVYTPEDRKIIAEESGNGIWWLCMRINVPPVNLYKKARLEGVSLPRTDYTFYGESETRQLAEASPSASDSVVAGLLRRPAYSVSAKRRREGIRKREIFRWEAHPEKDRYLISHSEKMSAREMAEHLGLRYYQVKDRLEKLRHLGYIVPV